MVDSAPDTRRYRLDLEYDGTDFAGWQVQPGERTVQGVIEAILGRVLGSPPRVTGAGRTDRGCHAAQQVAHFDAPAAKPAVELQRALRALLPEDVRLRRFGAVGQDFHARYGAIERAYRYRIGRRRSVFGARFRWDLGCRLRLAGLRQASAGLLGEHDFRAYAIGEGGDGDEAEGPRAGRCQVWHADWEIADGGYRFTIVADRFLTRMVRLLVGAMVEVGLGAGDPVAVGAKLGGPPPAPRPAAAPASGLTLAWVRYAGDEPRIAGAGPRSGRARTRGSRP